MMNDSAAAILRVQQSDMIGRSVQKLGSQFADVVLQALGEGIAQQRRQVYDTLTKQMLGLSVTPLGDVGAAIIFAPIPAEAEADVNFDYSPFWEYLAARVAQEIKNPLVAINTFTQLLPRKYDSEEFRSQFSDVVHQEVDRINRVVETLFDFARHPELVLQRSDLHTTLDTVLESFRPELQASEVSVERDYEANLDEVDLDPVFFSRAFHNVVRNAIEAMRDGGSLRITTQREGDQVRIEVIDSGTGVPTDIASLIFLPYFSTKEKGMGLGLTVAGRIARQHQGGLELTPMADGACFSFMLPFRQTAPTERTSANPAQQPNQASVKA
jgi:nitrogen fixation/metabolism regulation signal transduction histidine kinase